ncbi:MAG TPA: hypothetical protein VG982_00430 [Candidatus Paceibacterota bacterium]|nr:hypothetical protein [Candidatus Paceibacterota bacterium]
MLGQKKLPKEKKPFPWRRFLWIAGILAVIVAVVLVTRIPKLQIQTIDVVGTTAVNPDDVSAFIKRQIKGEYLFVIPKGSMLTVATSTISTTVAHAFPRFSSVRVSRRGINGLLVTVTEHATEYLWCEQENSCFSMTKEGVVYAPASQFSGDAYLKLFGGEKGSIPFSPFSQDKLSVVATLLDRLPAIDIKPTEIHFISDYEFDVVFSHNGADAMLMFDPGNDIEVSLEALYSGLKTDPLASDFDNQKKTLQYIDLRFPNKVVYKFN